MIDTNKLIEEYSKKNSGHLPESYNRLFVSSVGFECMLQKYMSILKPEPFDIDTIKRMTRGNIYHTFLEDIIRMNYGSSIITEKDNSCRVEKDYGNFSLYGRCDLIKIDENGIYIPIELKSYDDRYGTKYIPNTIHIHQLNMYLDILDVDVGYLCYVGFNLDTYWYEIHKDKQLIDNIIKKCNTLSNYLKNNIIPTEKSKGWLCKTCKYKDECSKIKDV